MAEGKRPRRSEAPDDGTRPRHGRRDVAGKIGSITSARTERGGLPRCALNASRPVRYRYRTAALVGPWRSDPEQAIDDAVRARQAGYEGGDRFHWLVPGSIESSVTAADRIETE